MVPRFTDCCLCRCHAFLIWAVDAQYKTAVVLCSSGERTQLSDKCIVWSSVDPVISWWTLVDSISFQTAAHGMILRTSIFIVLRWSLASDVADPPWYAGLTDAATALGMLSERKSSSHHDPSWRSAPSSARMVPITRTTLFTTRGTQKQPCTTEEQAETVSQSAAHGS